MKYNIDRQKLIEKMAECRMNRVKLAAACGLHKNTVAYLLNGNTKNPTEITAVRIALALGCKPEDICTIEGDAENDE